MKYVFLDAGFDVGFGDVILVLFIIPLGIILLEAFVMYQLKFNKAFAKCFLDSFLANLATVVVGYLVGAFLTPNISIGRGNIIGILGAFTLSVIVEGLILFALNNKKPSRKVWKTSLIMNLASYVALIIVTLI
ncbi:MAG TPA: hypothetical protein VLJ68_01540, partial [Chitinophagaceae bacterium]|nr:hypothetical protein [Chitinophagaceae bacterium]